MQHLCQVYIESFISLSWFLKQQDSNKENYNMLLIFTGIVSSYVFFLVLTHLVDDQHALPSVGPCVSSFLIVMKILLIYLEIYKKISIPGNRKL